MITTDTQNPPRSSTTGGQQPQGPRRAKAKDEGSAAKAGLVGAKMVKGPGPVRVSASPALTASSTRVEAPFLCSSSTMLLRRDLWGM